MPGCCIPSTAGAAAAKPTMPAAASACPAADLAADSTSGADRATPAAYLYVLFRHPLRGPTGANDEWQHACAQSRSCQVLSGINTQELVRFTAYNPPLMQLFPSLCV
jgi:hypothetical protein